MELLKLCLTFQQSSRSTMGRLESGACRDHRDRNRRHSSGLLWLGYSRNRRYEAIPTLAHRSDKLRGLGYIAKYFAQLVDADFQYRFTHCSLRPERLEQVVLRY